MRHIAISKPDDWHLHLRDGQAMADILPFTSKRFARAIVMPNLDPPIVNASMAERYRARILQAVPPGHDFEPLMTIYLTATTTTKDIADAHRSEYVKAVKYYPAGATTNARAGVRAIEKVYPIIETMQKHDLPLLVHGEDIDPATDIFDREQIFIEKTLAPLSERFPQLRIVFEHITTSNAVDFVEKARPGIAATITPQHILMNRNQLFSGGIRPHHYCLPVLKQENHRQRIAAAATSGNPRFFLGSDSAPHATAAKQSACGCAGIFSAPAAIELYAEAFDAMEKLDRLEGFASHFGADFYRLPRNTGTISLTRKSWQVPAEFNFGDQKITPFRSGEQINWSLDPDSGDV